MVYKDYFQLIATIVSSLISVGSLFFIGFRQNSKARTALTIEFMKIFIERQKTDYADRRLMSDFIFSLRTAQCAGIHNEATTEFDSSQVAYLRDLLGEKNCPPTVNGGKIILLETQVTELRSRAYTYMNLYEMFAAGYVNKLVNEKLFKWEFGSLLFKRGGEPMYKVFAETSSIYPSVNAMYAKWPTHKLKPKP